MVAFSDSTKKVLCDATNIWGHFDQRAYAHREEVEIMEYVGGVRRARGDLYLNTVTYNIFNRKVGAGGSYGGGDSAGGSGCCGGGGGGGGGVWVLTW
ncbi:Hypothetical predicted protein [Octopus vulgaris]|uniref:Uncharacterized protein n=1 Tax=Octopus vulgaris TaxID=6645 RepID=A0AA36B0E6_OCTVU|nr:Hypothetical predicted protein [Octopus vulgaris]